MDKEVAIELLLDAFYDTPARGFVRAGVGVHGDKDDAPMVFCKVLHVSRSGLRRVVGVWAVQRGDDGGAWVAPCWGSVGAATGMLVDEVVGGVVVDGYGFDAVHEVADRLGRALGIGLGYLTI